jgi:hypothetical protein
MHLTAEQFQIAFQPKTKKKQISVHVLNKSFQVETYKPKCRHGRMSSELMCGPQGFNVGHNYKDVYGNLTFLCWAERFQRTSQQWTCVRRSCFWLRAKGFQSGSKNINLCTELLFFLFWAWTIFWKFRKTKNAKWEKLDFHFFVILKIKIFRKIRSWNKLDNKIKRCPRALRFENGVRAR